MHTPDSWPIGAALLQLSPTTADGVSLMEAHPREWTLALREVKHAGFAHIDLTDSWLRPGDLTPDRRRDLNRAVAEAGLGISAISVTRRSILDPADGPENIAYSYRSIDAAADLGVEYLCLGLHRPLTPAQLDALWFWHEPGAGDPLDDPETYRHAVRTFRELGRYAAERGVQLSLEMYEDTLLGTADACVRLITDVDLPNVGLNPDVTNVLRLHRPIERWEDQFAKMLPHTNYLHVKNCTRDFDAATGSYATAPAALEFGIINFRKVLGDALALGFAGPLCVEHYGGDGLSVAARNRDYLRTILAAKLTAPAPTPVAG